MTRWLSVIGIGEDGIAGLSPAARALIETAQTLVGGARHLAMVPEGGAERLLWRQPLADTIADIAARRGTRVAVLASGDPLWYGVGTVLLRHFRREEMTILPQPSAFSLAAARLGWALAECTALSLHGRPLDSLAPASRAGPALPVAVGRPHDAAPGGEAARREPAGDRAGSACSSISAGRARRCFTARRRIGASGRAPTSTRSRSNAR